MLPFTNSCYWRTVFFFIFNWINSVILLRRNSYCWFHVYWNIVLLRPISRIPLSFLISKPSQSVTLHLGQRKYYEIHYERKAIKMQHWGTCSEIWCIKYKYGVLAKIVEVGAHNSHFQSQEYKLSCGFCNTYDFS